MVSPCPTYATLANLLDTKTACWLTGGAACNTVYLTNGVHAQRHEFGEILLLNNSLLHPAASMSGVDREYRQGRTP